MTKQQGGKGRNAWYAGGPRWRCGTAVQRLKKKNRIRVLQKWYQVDDLGSRSALNVCVLIGVDKEKPQRCLPSVPKL